MTLDEAIKHCEEVAQEQDMKADFETDNQTYIMSEMERKRYRECADEHWQLAEWLRELKAYKESDWIPCSERLPNRNGCYLVWRPHFWGGEKGMPAICYFDGQNTWHDSYGVDFERVLHPDDVTAWKPLPEPYRGE